MCTELYDQAAKCEKKFDFQFIYNQESQDESVTCPFVESILYDSYTETGVINVSDVQDVVLRGVTGKQYMALLGFLLVFGALWQGKRYYERKITEMNERINIDYVQQMSNLS